MDNPVPLRGAHVLSKEPAHYRRIRLVDPEISRYGTVDHGCVRSERSQEHGTGRRDCVQLCGRSNLGQKNADGPNTPITSPGRAAEARGLIAFNTSSHVGLLIPKSSLLPMNSGMKWTCASLRPGITSRPCRSMTCVAVAARPDIASKRRLRKCAAR